MDRFPPVSFPRAFPGAVFEALEGVVRERVPVERPVDDVDFPSVAFLWA